MKILIITQDFPFPLNAGNRLRTWNFINALSKENELSFLCLVNESSGEENQSKAEEYFRNFWWVSTNGKRKQVRSPWKDRIFNLLKGVPWEVGFSFQEDFDHLLDKIFFEHSFDVVLVRYMKQARYLFKHVKQTKARIIFDIDDIDPRKTLREYHCAGYSGFYDMFRKKINIWIYERYHRKHLPMFDRCLVCSEEDRAYVLGKKWSKKVTVVPNAVDAGRYTVERKVNRTKMILFCGVIGYEPNENGLLWFIKDVFPYIKQMDSASTFVIVGRDPTAEVLQLSDNKNIFVYPNVESVVPYYQKANLVIAPIHIGGGTRIKILEAACCYRPVVSTTIGAEGLRLVPGKHCLIADDEKEFARACLKLMDEPDLAQNLAEANYRFVKENYDSSIVQNLIAGIFKENPPPLKDELRAHILRRS